jgi:HAD superfamily hydrolase (TIGR01509 family)
MIKALIFDCDGTLVDSEYLANVALEAELLKYGIELSAQVLLERFRGGQFSQVLVVLAQEYQVVFAENFAEQFRENLALLLAKQLKTFDGVSEALDAIQLPMSVASNSPFNQLKLSLQVTDIARFFGQHIYSAYQISIWKPDPGLFLHAAQNLGFPPSECLVIEDSPVGVGAAKAASMQVVLFDPANQHPELEVDYRIANMAELVNLVGEFTE